jgi:hypothetical protein
MAMFGMFGARSFSTMRMFGVVRHRGIFAESQSPPRLQTTLPSRTIAMKGRP